MVHCLAVHLSRRYGCTWKGWRALEKLVKYSASSSASYHTLPLYFQILISARIHLTLDLEDEWTTSQSALFKREVHEVERSNCFSISLLIGQKGCTN